jgi:1,4-alpha-glucan branching enzyme
MDELVPITRPSTQTGMGPVLHDGGCTFRVWAPHAHAVHVFGSGSLAGPEIALARDAVSGDGAEYWSVFVPGVQHGDQYRYRLRDVHGAAWTRMDPRARDATSSAGDSLVCDTRFDWSSDTFRAPPWNQAIIYELHVGTFSVRPGAPVGDFGMLVERLDYLRDLGVNLIQIMPAFEFDLEQSVGYNPALPFALESAYGDPHAFKRLVLEAHARGIGVILDVVYNHWGPEGLGECLWRFDGWSQHEGGGAYFYNDTRRHTPWGDRPDYGRAAVRQYIQDHALTMLHEYRVDGLRWDSTGCCRRNRGFCGGECCGERLDDGWRLMRQVNDAVNGELPWKVSIAEDLYDDEAITAPTSDGGAGFDAQWDPSFLHPVREAVIAQWDEQRNMQQVKYALEHRYRGDAFRRVAFVESHNEAVHRRLTEEICAGDAVNWHAKKRSTLAASVLLTAPAIPMLFQGQEFLEWGSWSGRQHLDWRKLEWFGGIHDLYRDLIRLRRNWYDNTRGLSGQHIHVHHVNDRDKLVAYHRYRDGGPGDEVVVLANFSNRAFPYYRIGLPRAGLWYVRFNGDYRGYDPSFGSYGGHDTWSDGGRLHGMPVSGALAIAPYSLLVLSQ